MPAIAAERLAAVPTQNSVLDVLQGRADVNSNGGAQLTVASDGAQASVYFHANQVLARVRVGDGGQMFLNDASNHLTAQTLSTPSGTGVLHFGANNSMVVGDPTTAAGVAPQFSIGPSAVLEVVAPAVSSNSITNLVVNAPHSHGTGAKFYVNGGAVAINRDAGQNSVNLSLWVERPVLTGEVLQNARVDLGSTQHLHDLVIGSGALVALTQGANKWLIVDSLFICGGASNPLGTVDLSDNNMIVHGGDASVQLFSVIESQINFSFHEFGMDLPGIKSSAIADPTSMGLGSLHEMLYQQFVGGPMIVDGEPIGLDDIVVKFTYVGDLTLDGVINDDDASVLSGYYDSGAADGHHWFEGDITHNGFINDDDASIFGGNYNPNAPHQEVVKAPVFTPATGPITVQPNQTLTLTLQATDPPPRSDSDPIVLTYSGVSLPPGAAIAGNQLTWNLTQHPAAPGIYFATVRVSNQYGSSDTETLRIQVGQPNLQIEEFSSDGYDLNVKYRVSGFDVAPFTIGVSASLDGVAAGTTLMSHQVTGAGQLTVGEHVENFSASFADPQNDYALMAQLNTGGGAIVESDLTDNLRAFDGGIFQNSYSSGGVTQSIVQVQGTDQADQVNVSGQGFLAVTLNGQTVWFPSSAASRIDIRLRGGDDVLTVGPAMSTPHWAFGGSGNDQLAGGQGADYLAGGVGDDTYSFDQYSRGNKVIVENPGEGTDALDLTAVGAPVSIDNTASGLQEVVPGLSFDNLGAASLEQLFLPNDSVDAAGSNASLVDGGRIFVVPGKKGETTNVLFTFTERTLLGRNTIGVFQVGKDGSALGPINGQARSVPPDAAHKSEYQDTAVGSGAVVFTEYSQVGDQVVRPYAAGTMLSFYSTGRTAEGGLIFPFSAVTSYPADQEMDPLGGGAYHVLNIGEIRVGFGYDNIDMKFSAVGLRGDLNIVNPDGTELPDKLEITPGGVVALHSLGESDPLPLRIHAIVSPQAKGEYLLHFSSPHITIWTQGGQPVVADQTTFDATKDTTVLVRGEKPSASAGEEKIWLHWTNASGNQPPSQHYVILMDEVAVTVHPVDLAIDANNNGAIDPDRSASGSDEPIKNDTDKPGKIIFVNDGDRNHNDVPDYAEGFRHFNPLDTGVAGDNFTPIQIRLFEPLDLKKVRIKIDYSASDPKNVSRVNLNPDFGYSVGSGSLRIWTKDGTELRNENSIAGNDAGDYVPSSSGGGGFYRLAQFKDAYSANSRTVTLYVEGILASRTQADQQIKIQVDTGANTPVLNDFVRLTVASVNIQRMGAGDWQDAGLDAPTYNPLPLMRLADVAKDQLTGGDTFDLHGSTFDTISYVPQVSYSINGGAWNSTTSTDEPPPSAGDSYEGTFVYTVSGLNDLRDNQPLGTRFRYLFRATSLLGFTAYDELAVEVRLDQNKVRYLEPINLGTPADATPPTIPADQQLRIHVSPVLDNASNIVSLSLGMAIPGFPDSAVKTALTAGEIQDTEFVLVDSPPLANNAVLPAQLFPFVGVDFSPGGDHNLQVTYSPIPAAHPNVSGADDVSAVTFSLDAPLEDADTKVTNPVAVLEAPQGTFAERQLYMTPMRLTGVLDNTFGRVEIYPSSTSTNVWEPNANAADGHSEVTVGESVSTSLFFAGGATPPTGKSFLVEGTSAGHNSSASVHFKYHGQDLFDDSIRFVVNPIPRLAGESVTGFPYFNPVHVFNAANPDHIADAVKVALDPYAWSQLMQHETLPETDAQKHKASIAIVPHRSLADWAADPNYMATAQVTDVVLNGESIQDNIRTAATGITQPGDYDVIIVAGGGSAGNIMILAGATTGGEVHVLQDPLTLLAYEDPTTKLVPYQPGYINYGTADPLNNDFSIPAHEDNNPATVDNNYIHGRIYYPATAAGHDESAEAGAFPVVMILHGNHIPDTHSGSASATSAANYLGYIYLQERLAKFGYASISVDLDRYYTDNPADTNYYWPYPGIKARAWAGAESLDTVAKLNATPGSAIFGHLDFSHVTLIGNSRGGEAVVELAEYWDTHTGPFATGGIDGTKFSIGKVISIAPTANNQTPLSSAHPYLAMQGSADGDVWDGGGFKMYDAALATKAMLFIDGANHNNFNSSWIPDDATVSTNDTNSLHANSAYQQNVAAAYSLSWIVGNDYLDYFSRPAADIRPPSMGLATVPIHNQFRRDATQVQVIDDFESSTNPNVVSLADQPNGYFEVGHGLQEAWDPAIGIEAYKASASAGMFEYLSFRTGATIDQADEPMFTLEVADSHGQVSYISTIAVTTISVPYAIQVAGRDASGAVFWEDATKTAFQTLRIRLDDFSLDGKVLDVRNIASIRFIFDSATKGKVVIDDVEVAH